MRIRYWGVELADDLPPEFVIEKHSSKRIDKRFPFVPDDEHHKKCMVARAWHNGTRDLPDDFDKNHKDRPGMERAFHNIRYTYYKDHIWVWGMFYNQDEHPLQVSKKHLITVRPWGKKNIHENS